MISPALGIGLFVAYLLLRNPRVSPVGGTENYGVMDKLLLCGKLVEAGMDSQAATEQLAATLRYVKPGDNKNELTVIYNRMDSMRYTNGPSNKDIIRGFGRAVSDKIGDCADKTVYGGVLLGMAGFPVRLKLVLPRGGRQWHIYPLAGVPFETNVSQGRT